MIVKDYPIMVTESKISIEEYLQWKSSQTSDASRDEPEDSDDEIGELIYNQSRTGKARAEVVRNSASDSNVLYQNESNSPPPSNRVQSKPPIIANDSSPLFDLCHSQGCTEIVKEGSCQMHGRGGGKCLKHVLILKKKMMKKKRIRRKCSVDGCSSIAQKGGVCYIHRPDRKSKKKKYKPRVREYTCSTDGCKNKAYIEGGKCLKHGGKQVKKTCEHDRCTNTVVKGGVCIRHGALVKTCSMEGCNNQVQNRGVCVKHGAKKVRKACSHDGCTNIAVKEGVCKRHGANKTMNKQTCIRD